MTKSILEFQGDYRFLSNFHPARVALDGVMYPSVEHAYQAAKTLDHGERLLFCAGSPGEAKRNGRKVTMREDWDEVKLGVMRDLVRQKFVLSGPLGDKLLDTGDAHIEEGNHWGDTFWGVCRGRGQNHLGKIIMSVREEMQR